MRSSPRRRSLLRKAEVGRCGRVQGDLARGGGRPARTAGRSARMAGRAAHEGGGPAQGRHDRTPAALPARLAVAVAWCANAAAQGRAVAQYNLGVSYTNGQGVQANYTMAAEWWRRRPPEPRGGQYNLGRYALGGVTRITPAAGWYRGSGAGYAPAQQSGHVLRLRARCAAKL